MDLRGQRFQIDLSDSEDETTKTPRGNIPGAAGALPFDFVSDIKERPTTAAKPPSAPKFKSTSTGFPEHKKRTKVSTFKQQRASNQNESSVATAPATSISTSQNTLHTNTSSLTGENDSFEEIERRRIDEENKQRLAAMSEEEIEQERRELFSGLNPSLIERLLKRGNIEDGRGDTGLYPEEEPASQIPKVIENQAEGPNPSTEEKGAAVPIPQPIGKRLKASKTVTFAEDEESTEPINLQPASEATSQPIALPQPAVHFPTSASTPDLDPSDPNFLSNLHEKYFPDLPADPSKLAWMAPIPTKNSPADLDSPYSPAHQALPASALRFDFRGALLPPRISRAIPISKGLHHHGEAPEAAGYTIPELARLARSAFPAQRCIAFQILGRILYRLGRGEWREGSGEIESGLWKCVEEGKVVEVLEMAAGVEGGHMGSRAYATEAIWLYQKGGGKAWKGS